VTQHKLVVDCCCINVIIIDSAEGSADAWIWVGSSFGLRKRARNVDLEPPAHHDLSTIIIRASVHDMSYIIIVVVVLAGSLTGLTHPSHRMSSSQPNDTRSIDFEALRIERFGLSSMVEHDEQYRQYRCLSRHRGHPQQTTHK